MPRKVVRADVAVVGGGPAGLTAALTLARSGAKVLVVDRSLARPTLGEGLPPVATPILQHLGLWEAFLSAGHEPSYGNQSAWGSPLLAAADFIRDAYGTGWHLDRLQFEGILGSAVRDLGVQRYCNTRVINHEWNGKVGWTLSLRSGEDDWLTQASYLIDATGRSRQLVRGQGVRRRTYDRLIGMVGTLASSGDIAAPCSTTLVEACPFGWWYANPIPGGRLVVGLMTDCDSAAARSARTTAGWRELLSGTLLVRERVERYGFRLECAPSVVSAASSQVETAAGETWCAAGDAAAAHDPLSSQGIMSALVSGHRAAHAILTAERGGLIQYAEWMQQTYAEYLAQWLAYYAVEQRWPACTFWKRRHTAMERVLAHGDSATGPTDQDRYETSVPGG